MRLGLGILAVQRVLAAWAPLRLDGNHHVYLVDRHQGPRLPLVARLSAWPAPPGLAARPFCDGLRGIARERPRGSARVLLPLLRQALDRGLQALHHGLQDGHARFEPTDIPLRLGC
jgi:hypothetical protein